MCPFKYENALTYPSDAGIEILLQSLHNMVPIVYNK